MDLSVFKSALISPLPAAILFFFVVSAETQSSQQTGKFSEARQETRRNRQPLFQEVGTVTDLDERIRNLPPVVLPQRTELTDDVLRETPILTPAFRSASSLSSQRTRTNNPEPASETRQPRFRSASSQSSMSTGENDPYLSSEDVEPQFKSAASASSKRTRTYDQELSSDAVEPQYRSASSKSSKRARTYDQELSSDAIEPQFRSAASASSKRTRTYDQELSSDAVEPQFRSAASASPKKAKTYDQEPASEAVEPQFRSATSASSKTDKNDQDLSSESVEPQFRSAGQPATGKKLNESAFRSLYEKGMYTLVGSNQDQNRKQPRIGEKRLVRLLTDFLNVPRFYQGVRTNTWSKLLMKEFFKYGLDAFIQDPMESLQWAADSGRMFTYAPIANVVAYLPGKNVGTPEDGIIAITGHYDTHPNRTGLNDNASGIAVMLAIARALTEAECQFDHTVMFVFLDQEEIGLLGSGYFVERFLAPKINSKRGYFQGAFNLDTIMNFNSAPQSQRIPDTMKMYVPELVEKIKKTNFKGDFMLVSGRRGVDDKIGQALVNNWRKLEKPKFKMYYMSATEARTPKDKFEEFFKRGDHWSFWRPDPATYKGTFSAVEVADTGRSRTTGAACYHAPCADETSNHNSQKLFFMKKLGDALIGAIMDLANGNCQNAAPLHPQSVRIHGKNNSGKKVLVVTDNAQDQPLSFRAEKTKYPPNEYFYKPMAKSATISKHPGLYRTVRSVSDNYVTDLPPESIAARQFQINEMIKRKFRNVWNKYSNQLSKARPFLQQKQSTLTPFSNYANRFIRPIRNGRENQPNILNSPLKHADQNAERQKVFKRNVRYQRNIFDIEDNLRRQNKAYYKKIRDHFKRPNDFLHRTVESLLQPNKKKHTKKPHRSSKIQPRSGSTEMLENPRFAKKKKKQTPKSEAPSLSNETPTIDARGPENNPMDMSIVNTDGALKSAEQIHQNVADNINAVFNSMGAPVVPMNPLQMNSATAAADKPKELSAEPAPAASAPKAPIKIDYGTEENEWEQMVMNSFREAFKKLGFEAEAPPITKPADEQEAQDPEKELPDAEKRHPDAEKRHPSAEKRHPDAEKGHPGAAKGHPDGEKEHADAEKGHPQDEDKSETPDMQAAGSGQQPSVNKPKDSKDQNKIPQIHTVKDVKPIDSKIEPNTKPAKVEKKVPETPMIKPDKREWEKKVIETMQEIFNKLIKPPQASESEKPAAQPVVPFKLKNGASDTEHLPITYVPVKKKDKQTPSSNTKDAKTPAANPTTIPKPEPKVPAQPQKGTEPTTDQNKDSPSTLSKKQEGTEKSEKKNDEPKQSEKKNDEPKQSPEEKYLSPRLKNIMKHHIDDAEPNEAFKEIDKFMKTQSGADPAMEDEPLLKNFLNYLSDKEKPSGKTPQTLYSTDEPKNVLVDNILKKLKDKNIKFRVKPSPDGNTVNVEAYKLSKAIKTPMFQVFENLAKKLNPTLKDKRPTSSKRPQDAAAKKQSFPQYLKSKYKPKTFDMKPTNPKLLEAFSKQNFPNTNSRFVNRHSSPANNRLNTGPTNKGPENIFGNSFNNRKPYGSGSKQTNVNAYSQDPLAPSYAYNTQETSPDNKETTAPTGSPGAKGAPENHPLFSLPDKSAPDFSETIGPNDATDPTRKQSKFMYPTPANLKALKQRIKDMLNPKIDKGNQIDTPFPTQDQKQPIDENQSKTEYEPSAEDLVPQPNPTQPHIEYPDPEENAIDPINEISETNPAEPDFTPIVDSAVPGMPISGDFAQSSPLPNDYFNDPVKGHVNDLEKEIQKNIDDTTAQIRDSLKNMFPFNNRPLFPSMGAPQSWSPKTLNRIRNPLSWNKQPRQKPTGYRRPSKSGSTPWQVNPRYRQPKNPMNPYGTYKPPLKTNPRHRTGQNVPQIPDRKQAAPHDPSSSPWTTNPRHRKGKTKPQVPSRGYPTAENKPQVPNREYPAAENKPPPWAINPRHRKVPTRLPPRKQIQSPQLTKQPGNDVPSPWATNPRYRKQKVPNYPRKQISVAQPPADDSPPWAINPRHKKTRIKPTGVYKNPLPTRPQNPIQSPPSNDSPWNMNPRFKPKQPAKKLFSINDRPSINNFPGPKPNGLNIKQNINLNPNIQIQRPLEHNPESEYDPSRKMKDIFEPIKRWKQQKSYNRPLYKNKNIQNKWSPNKIPQYRPGPSRKQPKPRPQKPTSSKKLYSFPSDGIDNQEVDTAGMWPPPLKVGGSSRWPFNTQTGENELMPDVRQWTEKRPTGQTTNIRKTLRGRVNGSPVNANLASSVSYDQSSHPTGNKQASSESTSSNWSSGDPVSDGNGNSFQSYSSSSSSSSSSSNDMSL